MRGADSTARFVRGVHTRRARSARRSVTVLLAGVVALCVGLVVAPTPSSALRLPRRPAVAGSVDPVAVTASDALAALWTNDPTYRDKLQSLVPLVATAAKVSPEHLAAAWSSASRRRMIVLLSALTQVGVPYQARMATAGVGFDCSGLTSWAWSQVGRYLPHQSGQQIRTIPRSSKDRLLPGDILYYPGHAMLALGVGLAMVHAPGRGKVMEISPPSSKWARIARVGTPDGKRAPLSNGAGTTTTTAPATSTVPVSTSSTTP